MRVTVLLRRLTGVTQMRVKGADRRRSADGVGGAVAAAFPLRRVRRVQGAARLGPPEPRGDGRAGRGADAGLHGEVRGRGRIPGGDRPARRGAARANRTEAAAAGGTAAASTGNGAARQLST